MKQLTITLFTKKEAEIYCKRFFAETKIVPIAVWEDGKRNTYYSVFTKLDNNGWIPVQEIDPEWVRE